MSSEMSVGRVLAKLKARAAVHREQQAFHAQKEAHHREQRERHEAELAKVNANLENFQSAAATALKLAAQPPGKAVLRSAVWTGSAANGLSPTPPSLTRSCHAFAFARTLIDERVLMRLLHERQAASLAKETLMAKHNSFNGSTILGIAVLCILTAATVAIGQTTQPAPAKTGALVTTPAPTPTPTPGPCPTRADASADYQAGMTAAQVMALYPGCNWPIPTPWSPLPAAEEWNPNYPVPVPPMKSIDNNGNTNWEGFDSCGYHPQDQVFSCVLEIRQTNQYWGFPEWVKFCIDYSDGLGFTPVDMDFVTVRNEPFNQAPIWYFAVNGAADARLAALPLNGRTYVARAALSWLFPPVSCNAPFLWGNTVTFRIRLD